MSSKKILAEIKKIESAAQAQVERACVEGKALCAEARAQAEAKIKAEEEKLRLEEANILEAAQKEAQASTRKILAENDQKIVALEKAANERMQKAISFVIGKI